MIMNREAYEVYAIRYATVERRAAENFLGGDPHDSGMPMDYFMWVVRNARKTWVIDTGFNAEAALRRKRQFLRSPIEGLELLGIKAEAVEDIIITHLHYDHVGNFDLFPNARFHIQDSEMAFATGRYMGKPFFSHAFEVDEVVGMVRNVFAGRVEFYDGEAELEPGLSLHHVGGHTKGLQVVRVWTEKGWLVLASDASHYAVNMNENRPFPIVVDLAEMFDGWELIRTLVDDPNRIIPGHDPEVMRLYKSPSKEMEGIVVRLDN